ncbi:hypothetical protein EYF80_024805 [Liparis tanakae]|uniref:Uncharacterized protein n=1 Tax=Liparis tanakae TaxID=230148 RepID=A0A4Z2HH51_9TELE|nr:hypothetical protein EYF80_024805 [Liparis tanakae]
MSSDVGDLRQLPMSLRVPPAANNLISPARVAPAVVLLRVAERVAARDRGGLRQPLPEVSVGDLKAAPQARAPRADGVGAAQAARHRRLEGQRLHGAGGVRAVLALLRRQERLGGVAPGRGRLAVGVAPPRARRRRRGRGPLLALPVGLAPPPRGLHAAAAALFVVVVDGGVQRGVRDVRARAGLRSGASGARGAGLGGGGRRAREASGESRWQRSLDRPRSRSPCFQCSERDTRGETCRRGGG